MSDPHTPGTPHGMDQADVEGRSVLGQHVRHTLLPADALTIRAAAAEAGAPEELQAELARLPDDGTYETISDIWAALGHGVEDGTDR